MFEFPISFIFIEEQNEGMTGRSDSLTPRYFLMSVCYTLSDRMNEGRRNYIWNGNIFSWYVYNKEMEQLNLKDKKYYYIGF